MGAKTSMLVFSDVNIGDMLAAKPNLSVGETDKLLQKAFPNKKFEAIAEADLSDTYPESNRIHAGVFSGVSVLASREFAIDYPSKLSPHFVAIFGKGTVVMHAMHGVVGWFAYAIWVDGKLVRSLSLSPDDGIMEDIGTRLPFEAPYWNGEHPLFEVGEEDDNFPFVFNPLDLGEAALRALFGYHLEGTDDGLFEPESIPLVCYQRIDAPWWKFW